MEDGGRCSYTHCSYAGNPWREIQKIIVVVITEITVDLGNAGLRSNSGHVWPKICQQFS